MRLETTGYEIFKTLFYMEKNRELKLRLILDRFSAEVFINDGEQVMTMVVYTDLAAEGICFFADGTVNMDVVKYDLV
ncbi:hypothetical protein NDGK_00881 [Clostridiales bacterium CHKCI001]|nr:hypothetical protein NDGK_00881 [Clostridiales bacterium CHKCI001]